MPIPGMGHMMSPGLPTGFSSDRSRADVPLKSLPGDDIQEMLLPGSDSSIVKENVRMLRAKGFPEQQAITMAVKRAGQSAQASQLPPMPVTGRDVNLPLEGQVDPRIVSSFKK